MLFLGVGVCMLMKEGRGESARGGGDGRALGFMLLVLFLFTT